jgi:hypothetical protein
MHRVLHLSAWRVCGVAGAVVVLVCVAAVCHIRTFSHAADCVCVLAAVIAYAVAVAAAWRIWPGAAGIAAGAVFVGPLLAVTVCVACFGAGSLLGLGFIALETTSPPEHTEEVSPTLSCRVYGWGAAFTDEGYVVYVYRHPPFVPLVQLEAARVSVDQTNPGDGPRSASCASVAAPLRS